MNPLLIKRLDQATVAALTALAVVILAWWWVSKGGLSGGLVNIERVEPLGYEFRVDINRAAWPELAQLPNVGEVLARRIVASRADAGPFREPEDLLRVDGIGIRRLEKIRGYLAPLPGDRQLVAQPR